MQFEAYIPTGIVAGFVDSIFFLGGNAMGNGIAFQRLQQTIIINLGSNFTVSGIYTDVPQRNENTATVWINGKQEIPFVLGNSGTTAMYAIGVRPGRLPWLAGLPAMTTNELAVDAADWASGHIFQLREQLQETRNTRTGFLLIEQ